MNFINYTHDGKAIIQPAALALSGLSDEKKLAMHALNCGIVLHKPDMEPAEQLALMDSLTRLAHALGEELFARATEQADDCEEDEDDPFDNTIPIPVEAFEDAGLWGKSLHIRSIEGAVVITEDTSDEDQVGDLMDSLGECSYDAAVLLNLMNRILRSGDANA